MIEMHSKYDNMHINVMFYALNCMNNHVLSCQDCMLSVDLAHSRNSNYLRIRLISFDQVNY